MLSRAWRNASIWLSKPRRWERTFFLPRPSVRWCCERVCWVDGTDQQRASPCGNICFCQASLQHRGASSLLELDVLPSSKLKREVIYTYSACIIIQSAASVWFDIIGDQDVKQKRSNNKEMIRIWYFKKRERVVRCWKFSQIFFPYIWEQPR